MNILRFTQRMFCAEIVKGTFTSTDNIKVEILFRLISTSENCLTSTNLLYFRTWVQV